MPTPTYTPLANLTLSSSASSVTFSSIPTTGYRDLVVVIDGVYLTDGFAQNFVVRLNNDSSSTYSAVRMDGNGSTTGSGADSATFFYIGGANNNQKFTMIVQLMDYSATDKHKTVLARQDTPARGTGATAGRWPSTSAVTSIQFFTLDSVNIKYASGTSFALYGISA